MDNIQFFNNNVAMSDDEFFLFIFHLFFTTITVNFVCEQLRKTNWLNYLYFFGGVRVHKTWMMARGE
jgi:hypothetical protein